MDKLADQLECTTTCLKGIMFDTRKVYINLYEDGYSFNGCEEGFDNSEKCMECGRRVLKQFENEISSTILTKE